MERYTMTNDMQSHKSIFPFCLSVGLGGLCVYFGVNSSLYTTMFLQDPFKSANPLWYSLLAPAQKTLGNLGLTAIAIIFIIMITKPFFSHLWDTFLGSQYDRFVDSIDINLKNIVTRVDDIGGTVDRYIKNQSGPLALQDCKTNDDFKKHIQHAYRELYGRHSILNGSLVSFVANRLLDGFYCDPHRSEIKKQIILSETESKAGYINWRETTDYKIHNIKFEEEAEAAIYPLTMVITSYAPGMEVNDWAKVASLFVSIDQEIVLDSRSHPEFRENRNDDGFFCWNEGDWILLRFAMKIPLHKEWTPVHIEEKTINSEDDYYYTANTQKPICGQSIDFELPEGFKFMRKPLISANLLFDGLPERVKKKLQKKEYVDITEIGERKYRIDIKDWILPGVILQFFWGRKSMNKE